VSEREERAVEHVRSAACDLFLAVPRGDHRERAQLGAAVLDVRDCDPRADDERTVEAEGGDCVDRLELPVGERALDELEPVRDPVDAVEDSSSRVTGGVRAKCSWISGSIWG
jgi:hypothetical protein